ncbi:MAG: YafY family transcriptional regulator [Chloroflexi bacterium]|nr:YafY family transcriptional regulator [Chloroflexota bacterium]
MYNPATRLLAILELLQSRTEISGQELAQALEVEERSIRRYIMMLRDMGIPIEGERGRHGSYSLRPGFRIPPLMFNADELTAVMMGLMLMRELGTTPRLAVASATAKIERVIPSELRQSAEALQTSLRWGHVQLDTYAVSSEWITTFTIAAHAKHSLNMTYVSADGTLTERTIDPYGLVLHARTWYIPAYCHLRADLRLFRLDRVRSVSPTDHQFSQPADFDPSRFVLNALAQLPGIYTFEIILHAALSTVETYLPSNLALLENAGDGTTLMRCYSDDPYWLARYLVGQEIPFTVLATDELRTALSVIADEILAGITRIAKSPNPQTNQPC